MSVFSGDVAVIGGGAAGLMCAIEAGKRGRRVVVLEHSREIGRKILISGGGRCNFTNLHTRPEHFLSANPHFAKSALARYTPEDFLVLVRRHGVPYHEKTLGQLFCDRSARDITSLLEAESAAAGVRIETGCAVRRVRRDSSFLVETAAGDFEARSLIVATGGLSVPKSGASPFGYEVASQFGLAIQPCRPALVPFTFTPAEHQSFADLAGVSLEAQVRTDRAVFRDKILFTHRGLSGPAILQISSYWSPGASIDIDLLPGVDLVELLRERRTEARALVAGRLPQRLAARWFELHPLSKASAALSDREIQVLSESLHSWTLQPAGTEGYLKAEVTAGGVDTAELSSQTLEARKVPGLFFVGEVVDVTGQLGGFNFQWAWASGFAAGQVA